MYCSNCGKEGSSENINFCGYCGNEFKQTIDVIKDTKDISNGDSIEHVETEVVEKLTLSDMKIELRNWGFGLIMIGIVSNLLPDILDPLWGLVLILLGVVTLLFRRRFMFIVIGIGLFWVGIMNIVAGGFGGWTIFGIIQIYWGIQEISKFRKYR